MRIPDKDAFKRLSACGLLGNTFRQWDTRDELRASGYQGYVTLRALQAGDNAKFIPYILTQNLMFWAPVLLAGCYFQEVPGPETERVVNLEAGYLGTPGVECGLYVRYSAHSALNLRHDLEQNGRDAYGLAALSVLKRYVREDLDTLRELWLQYPDAIIEASVFSRPVGVFNSPLVVWEVRNY